MALLFLFFFFFWFALISIPVHVRLHALPAEEGLGAEGEECIT
jgi:hypothetical protein